MKGRLKDPAHIECIINRIRSAKRNSQIAVFMDGKDLYTVFADTVTTKKWLKNPKAELVGLFDQKQVELAESIFSQMAGITRE